MPLPALVELMGVPGAGKSTVAAALQRREPAIRVPPILTRGPYRAGLAPHLARTTGMLVRRRALDRRWTPTFLAMTAYLDALPEVLEREGAPGDVVLFDQGPLYTLTRDLLLDDRVRGFWERAVDRWARLLDVVVWLDAPDAVLAGRIHGRDKAHRLKGARDETVDAVLARDRAAFERAMARIAAATGGPAVLRFDTAAVAPDDVAAEVLAALGR